ncbi:hypothetical protein D3C81_1398220 [compost metagenome]
MRIDLALQRLQLRLFLLLLYPVNILDQLADAGEHTVELMTKQAYLIPAFYAEVDVQITVLHLFHQLNHLCQRFSQGKGQNNGDNQCEYDNNQCRRQGCVAGQLHITGQFIDRNGDNHLPVCLRGTRINVQPFLARHRIIETSGCSLGTAEQWSMGNIHS